MDFSKYKRLSIEEGSVKKIECAGVTLWKKGYINQVPISVDTDGSIYNGGLGYKIGCRVRSGGTEVSSDAQGCTGFIQCKGKDVLRFGFVDLAQMWTDTKALNTFINFSDSNKTNLGQITSQPANYGIFEKMPNEYKNIKKVNGFWEYEIIDGYNIGFVRFTLPYSGLHDLSKFIATVNEEIVL